MTMKPVYPSGKALAKRRFVEYTGSTYTTDVQKTTRFVQSSRVSVNTPNYAVARNNGTLPVNNYAFAEHHLTALGSSQTLSRSAVRDPFSIQEGPLALHYFQDLTEYTWNGKFPPISLNDSTFKDELSARFLRKMRSGSFDAGVALGEARETARFISHRGGLVASVLLEMIARRPAALKRRSYSESIHNLWLEYQYALKPLVSDIQSALGVLDSKQSYSVQRSVVAARKDYKDRRVFSNSFSAYKARFDCTVESVGSKSGIMVIEYEMDNPLYARLSSLGLINPLSTLYQLTPNSFVFDWFLPVGDYLGNLTATAGYRFKRGYRCLRSEMSHVGAVTAHFGQPDTQQPNCWTGTCSESVYGKQFRFERESLSSFPTPPLPEFRFRGLFSEFVSGAALVRQRLTR